MDRQLTSEYEQMKRRLDESIRKDEARQKILRKKREEKKAIRKAGGGRAIAKAIMPDDTDFEFGHNSSPSEASEDIDRRIAQEAAGRCMGRVACTICKKFHGYCVEIDEQKEQLKMLPTGNEPQNGARNKRAGGQKWLTNEMLSTSPQEAKILAVRYNQEGRFGARVEMKLAFRGEIIFWGVPPGKDPKKNANYIVLTKAFGHDENDWADQRIQLFLEQDEWSGNYFVHCEAEGAKKETAGRKK